MSHRLFSAVITNLLRVARNDTEGLLSLRETKDDGAISASMDQSLKPLSNPRFVSGTAMQAAS
jgi:hypothetical protein